MFRTSCYCRTEIFGAVFQIISIRFNTLCCFCGARRAQCDPRAPLCSTCSGWEGVGGRA